MPRGGNNRIPPSHHRERGTYRANRHGALPNDPAMYPPLASEPPDFLSVRGRRVWERLHPIVTEQGIVTELERGIFTAYCDSEGMYLEAVEHVRDEGCFKKPKRGERAEGGQRSPWYRVMQDSLTQMKSLAAMLGLTPVDRHRVAKVKPTVADREGITDTRPPSELDAIGDIRLLQAE